MADYAVDPYYYMRDIQAFNAQQRALGQSKGMTPEALSSAIRANFEAQQQEEITQKNIQLAERRQDLAEQTAKAGQKTAMYSGLANIALTAPGAIKGYRDIYREWGGPAGTKTTVDPTATAGSAAQASQAMTTALQPQTSDMAITGGYGVSGVTPTATTTGTVSATTPELPSITSQAGITNAPLPAGGASMLESVGGGIAGATAGYNIGRQLVHGKYSTDFGLLMGAGGAALGIMFPELAAGAAIASVVSGMIHW